MAKATDPAPSTGMHPFWSHCAQHRAWLALGLACLWSLHTASLHADPAATLSAGLALRVSTSLPVSLALPGNVALPGNLALIGSPSFSGSRGLRHRLTAFAGESGAKSASTPAWDHPFHRSEADAAINPENGHLEVALRVDSVELEAALRVFSGQPLSLDRPSECEAALEAYVRDCCQVKTRWAASPRPAPANPRRPGATAGWASLDWVGFELEGLDAWLYFEFTLPADGDFLDWGNALLCERHPFQENLATLTDRRGRRQSLRTTPDAPWTSPQNFHWRPNQTTPHQPLWTTQRPPTPHTQAWWTAQGQSWRR